MLSTPPPPPVLHPVKHVRSYSALRLRPRKFVWAGRDVVVIPPDDGLGSGTPIVVAIAEPAKP